MESERESWIPAFARAGLSKIQLMNMSDEEFNRTCQFVIDCGLASKDLLDSEFERALVISAMQTAGNIEGEPNKAGTDENKNNKPDKPRDNSATPPPPPAVEEHKPPKRKNQPHTVSGEIRNTQNEEYELAQILALQKEYEENERLERERREKEEAIRKEEEEKRAKLHKIQETRLQIIAKCEAVAPEPANGIQIAVNLPSKRFIRKFSPESLCDELFDLIAAEDDAFDDDGNPKSFILTIPMGPDLSRGKTFAEQGITRRSLLNFSYE